MKKLLCITLFAVPAMAQPNTVDQLKKKLKEINQLMLSIPEIKPLLDEQAKLYKQKINIENATGITTLNKQYAQIENQITLAREKEVGAQLKPLKEQYNLLRIEREKARESTKNALQDPNFQRLNQEEYAVSQKIDALDAPYRNQINENMRSRMEKINSLANEQYKKILERIPELIDEIIYEKLNDQTRELFIKLSQQYTQLRGQLMKEKPYDWREIVGDLEKDSILKPRHSNYDWSLKVYNY